MAKKSENPCLKCKFGENDGEAGLSLEKIAKTDKDGRMVYHTKDKDPEFGNPVFVDTPHCPRCGYWGK